LDDARPVLVVTRRWIEIEAGCRHQMAKKSSLSKLPVTQKVDS